MTAVKGLTVGKISDDAADPVVTPGGTAGVVITCAARSGVLALEQALISIRATKAKAKGELVIRSFL